MLKILVYVSLFFYQTYAEELQFEDKLKAVFIGKFAHYIDWPLNNKEEFEITMISTDPFNKLLDTLYKNKKINNKNVKIRYIKKFQEIDKTDILYITDDISRKEQEKIIAYAKKNAILTISENNGFAQMGGIIQLFFVAQNIKLRINYAASLESSLIIRSPLLSISEVIR